MSTVATLPAQEAMIDEAEKARRRFAVETANGNQRGEGIHVTPFLQQLQERYIAGEISNEQAIAELDKRYNRKR